MDLFDRIDCAIFDLDGTLIDSLDVWSTVDIKFMQKRNLPVPEGFYSKVASMSFSQAADFVISEYGIKGTREDIVSEWLSMAQYEYANTIEMVDGAKEFLIRLRSDGKKIALATASDPSLYIPCLKRHGVYDFFDVFVTTEQVERKKGFPDIYLLAAEKSGVSPEKCVVFEDIYPGCAGARAAGMFCVGVFERHSADDWGRIKALCDMVITSFREIL